MFEHLERVAAHVLGGRGRQLPPHLADVEPLSRFILTMPPRHSKTETCAIRFPLWLLEQDPTLRILVGTYAGRYAMKIGKKGRDIADQLVHQGRLRQGDVWTQEYWETADGGCFAASGRGQFPMGEGFDLIDIEDVYSSQREADSGAAQNEATVWYKDLIDRLEGKTVAGGTMMVNCTRYGPTDPAGHFMRIDEEREPSERRWLHVNLPAEADENDPLGREPGEALWPERWPLSKLKLKWDDMADPRLKELRYNGRIVPVEGHTLPVQRVRKVAIAEVPPGLRRCMAIDLATSFRHDSDYTVAIVLAGPDVDDRFYWIDTLRVWREVGDRDPLLQEFARRHRTQLQAELMALAELKSDRVLAGMAPAEVNRLAYALASQLIDDGKVETSSGVPFRVRVPYDRTGGAKTISTYFRRLFSGFNPKCVKPLAKKEIRAEPLAITMGEGRVCLVTDLVWPLFEDRGKRLPPRAAQALALDELRTHGLEGGGRHDDIGDALSDAYLEVSEWKVSFVA